MSKKQDINMVRWAIKKAYLLGLSDGREHIIIEYDKTEEFLMRELEEREECLTRETC